MGADPQATLAARQAVWRRVAGLVYHAVGTDLVLPREPSDSTLRLMGDAAEEQLDRLEEQGRRHRTRRELIEPTVSRIGPRTWIQTTGPIETDEQ